MHRIMMVDDVGFIQYFIFVGCIFYSIILSHLRKYSSTTGGRLNLFYSQISNHSDQLALELQMKVTRRRLKNQQ
jgi:hypothetical protein